MPNEDLLLGPLQEVAAVDWVTGPHFSPYGAVQAALDGSADADPRVLAILNWLHDHPDLRNLGCKWQEIAGEYHEISHRVLCAWLISRAAETSPDSAIQDLHKFLSAPEFECQEVLVFSGLRPEGACELGRDIKLLPWRELPDSTENKMARQRGLLEWTFDEPTGVLCRVSTIKKSYHSEIPSATTQTRCRDLYSGLMCIGIIRPPTPYPRATWVSFPDWVPFRSFPLTRKSPSLQSDQPFAAEAQAATRALFEAFMVLPKDRQMVINLAMQRIDQLPRKSLVDAAIDLGIALEALYLDDLQDDRGELNFRLRIRAAQYMGADLAERKRVYELIGKIYNIRSICVHTGKLPSKLQPKSIRLLLDEGAKVATETARRLITSGHQPWDDIVLS